MIEDTDDLEEEEEDDDFLEDEQPTSDAHELDLGNEEISEDE